MTSKAAKRARKRSRITLPGGVSLQQRPTGADRRHIHQPQEPADLVALQARIRHSGRDMTLRDARSPLYGCNAGRSIIANVADYRAAADLWDAVQHIRQTIAASDLAMGAPNRFAQSLQIMLPTATFEATADTPAIDDRSDEQKAMAALMAWGRLHDALGDNCRAAVAICVEDQPVASWPAFHGMLSMVVAMRRGA